MTQCWLGVYVAVTHLPHRVYEGRIHACFVLRGHAFVIVPICGPFTVASLGSRPAGVPFVLTVSGILLQVSSTAAVILDCGEGTWHQMLRVYGHHGQTDVAGETRTRGTRSLTLTNLCLAACGCCRLVCPASLQLCCQRHSVTCGCLASGALIMCVVPTVVTDVHVLVCPRCQRVDVPRYVACLACT